MHLLLSVFGCVRRVQYSKQGKSAVRRIKAPVKPHASESLAGRVVVAPKILSLTDRSGMPEEVFTGSSRDDHAASLAD